MVEKLTGLTSFDPLGNNMPWAGKLLVYVILVPVEILGMFTKPIALMIRLLLT